MKWVVERSYLRGMPKELNGTNGEVIAEVQSWGTGRKMSRRLMICDVGNLIDFRIRMTDRGKDRNVLFVRLRKCIPSTTA